MGKEFELKYTANGDALERIATQWGSFSVISMETTYYDTPDCALSSRSITLRRRLENGVSVCTVKTPEKDHCRGEWETEAASVETALEELCKLGCPVDLPALCANGIIAACGARFTRRAKTIALDGAVVELALDEGILLGGGKEIPLQEVEVELKSGKPAVAIAFAAQLAAQFSLKVQHSSKFRRALALARGE